MSKSSGRHFDVRGFGKRNVTDDKRSVLAEVVYWLDFAKDGDELTVRCIVGRS